MFANQHPVREIAYLATQLPRFLHCICGEGILSVPAHSAEFAKAAIIKTFRLLEFQYMFPGRPNAAQCF